MPSTLIEITGVYRGERIRFGDDCAIINVELTTPDSQLSLDIDEPTYTAVKVEAAPDELVYGLSYRFYGRWVTYRNQQQLHAQTFIRCQPHGRAGVIRYLCEAPHVGRATADLLWQKFQSDAVRILREQPEVAVAAVNASHFTSERAEAAAVFLRGEAALESCTIDLIDLLGGRGFPKSTAKRAIQAWGNRAAQIIKRSPYNLMRFRGCGFLRADAMFLEFGGAPSSLKRQAYCCWHALAKNTEGHTWHPVQYMEWELKAKIGGATVDAPAALKLAKRGRAVATRRDEAGRLWVAENKRAAAELRVAECVAEASLERSDGWPLPLVGDAGRLSLHQQEKLADAIGGDGMIGILGGSPGTGKTYSAAVLIRGVVDACGASSIAVCAPTGKAAVRVTEALASYGLNLRATTIHSLLKVVQVNEGDGWSFEHNERFPLPQRFIVVDESSMIDAGLMASLLSARGNGCHVLFVGDINQLPPVGHGAPLRDLIAAGLPYGELTEIRRNAGTIVRACAQIRDGRPFTTDRAIDLTAEPPANLRLLEVGEPEQQIQKMLAVLQCAAADDPPKHPVWDCQVIVPVNAKSKLSRKDLNKLLQRELNKTGQRAGANPFVVGDKIVCLKNSFTPGDSERNEQKNINVETDADGKVFVANGELAEVVEVADKLTHARLLSPERYVKIPRGGNNGDETSDDDKHGARGEDPAKESANTGCQWDLGYALSGHKSQGSEWPVVVVMIDDYAGARLVCSREWIYTSVSRAKQLCVLIGKRATVDGFCKRLALMKRKTFLKELIAEKVKEYQGRGEVGEAKEVVETLEMEVEESAHASHR